MGYANFISVQATTPAVSVLSLLLPNVVAVNPFCMASCISSGEKSPSGPINMSWFLVESVIWGNSFLGNSSPQ